MGGCGKDDIALRIDAENPVGGKIGDQEPGAFALQGQDYGSFAAAMRQKLRQEVA